jgi:DNA-binding response OmpR family regulator
MSNILVVDDEFDVAEILCSIIEDEGHSVTRCRSGAAGRAALAEARPDLVLLDVMMPDGNGLDVLREMRADPNLESVPVILISSIDTPVDPGGRETFLRKPFTFEALMAEVEALLGRGGKRRPSLAA